MYTYRYKTYHRADKKNINAISQFVVRNEIMSLISVRSNPSIE